jgi:MFS family permease
MNHKTIRTGLYLERLAVAFSSGLFLVLPLYFQAQGWNEVFFGKVYAAGAIGTLLCVALGAVMIRSLGLSKVAPLGSLLYAIGCLLYLVFDLEKNVNGYYIASLIQGAGWGLVFTMGPICMSTTVDSKTRSYYFTIYAAYSTLGVGVAPLIARGLTQYLHWTYQDLFILGAVAGGIAFVISAVVARDNTAYQSANVGTGLSGWSEFITVIRQPSAYFFAMVFFGACVYTAMINLQTTFATAQKIDYTVFYFFYSLAVVLSRFFLSKPLSKIAPKRAIYYLMMLMIFALVLMFWAEYSLLCYAVSSLLLGISYGLVYPIVQAQATNHAPAHLQPQTLVYFSLSYFFAVYLFPYFGASIAISHSYSALLWVLILAAAAELLTALYFYTTFQKSTAALATKLT